MNNKPKNIIEKILDAHNVGVVDNELQLYPDQILTQDATATPVFLQVEAMGLREVKPFTVSYVDHNTLQTDYKNHDDHLFLESMARKLGIVFSKPGNGICHQVHIERFSIPGTILVGSDSHTPTAGGAGMLAIGAGGLDIAASMAGQPFIIPRPRIIGIRLTGKLPPWSSAKDIILYILKTTTVKGGVGKIYEYFGEGVATLCHHVQHGSRDGPHDISFPQ
jgi:aconitate hydratase